MRVPWFKFYPGDWAADRALRACSIAARGVWIEIICQMHEGTPYGYLTEPGTEKPMEIETLARIVGIRRAYLQRLIDELVEKGVAEKEDTENDPKVDPKTIPKWILKCRKMIRQNDMKTRRKRHVEKVNSNDTNTITIAPEALITESRNARAKTTPEPEPEPDNQDASLRSAEIWENPKSPRRGSTARVSSSQSEAREVDPDKAPEPVIVGNTLRALNELKKPKAELELELTAPPSTELEKRPENPYRFVAYWQDANKERDFGIVFEPEQGPADFIDSEVDRMQLKAPRQEIDRAVSSSLERFRAEYSKRSGHRRRGGKAPKTRGSQIGPQRLTEELVAWIRKDLARVNARPDYGSSKSKARAKASRTIDETIQRLEREGQRERR